MRRIVITASMLAAVCLMIFAFAALPTSGQEGDYVNIDSIAKSRIAVNNNGSIELINWGDTKNARYLVKINIGKQHSLWNEYIVNVSLNQTKFIENSLHEIIKTEGTLKQEVVKNVKATQEGFSFALNPTYEQEQRGQIRFYFEAQQSNEPVIVQAQVTPAFADSFKEGSSIRVADYVVLKKLANDEIALGMAGMTKQSIVYIISDVIGNDIIRVVVDKGDVLGFAKLSEGILVSVEYDMQNKYYISGLTKKKIMDKDALIGVLTDLKFSYITSPDEAIWLKNQYTYFSAIAVKINPLGFVDNN